MKHGGLFESDVILNGGQAFHGTHDYGAEFESDVILNGGQAVQGR